MNNRQTERERERGYSPSSDRRRGFVNPPAYALHMQSGDGFTLSVALSHTIQVHPLWALLISEVLSQQFALCATSPVPSVPSCVRRISLETASLEVRILGLSSSRRYFCFQDPNVMGQMYSLRYRRISLSEYSARHGGEAPLFLAGAK